MGPQLFGQCVQLGNATLARHHDDVDAIGGEQASEFTSSPVDAPVIRAAALCSPRRVQSESESIES